VTYGPLATLPVGVDDHDAVAAPAGIDPGPFSRISVTRLTAAARACPVDHAVICGII